MVYRAGSWDSYVHSHNRSGYNSSFYNSSDWSGANMSESMYPVFDNSSLGSSSMTHNSTLKWTTSPGDYGSVSGPAGHVEIQDSATGFMLLLIFIASDAFTSKCARVHSLPCHAALGVASALGVTSALGVASARPTTRPSCSDEGGFASQPQQPTSPPAHQPTAHPNSRPAAATPWPPLLITPWPPLLSRVVLRAACAAAGRGSSSRTTASRGTR